MALPSTSQATGEGQSDTASAATSSRFSGLSRVLRLGTWSLLLLSVCGWGGRAWWLLDLTSHFRVQYLGIAVIVTLVWLVARNWSLALLATVCLIINLVPLGPYWLAARDGSTTGATVRVMSFNVNSANREGELVRETIRDCDPDLLFVWEFNDVWQESLGPLEAAYPHRRLVPQADNFGMAVYSRIPLARIDCFQLVEPGFWALEVEFAAGDQMWRVVGVHVIPPMSAEATRLRNEQFRELADRLAGVAGPTAVVGDLNCTAWSPCFDYLLEPTGLRDSGSGFGLQPTWPAQIPLMMIPIDHCLVSESVQVTGRMVTAACGSDHRGLVVDLAAHERTVTRPEP